jgi:hypothetical protein
MSNLDDKNEGYSSYICLTSEVSLPIMKLLRKGDADQIIFFIHWMDNTFMVDFIWVAYR